MALLAAAALIALVPTAAQGSSFTASTFPVDVSGEETETASLTFEAGKVTCDASFTASLSETSEALELEPELTNCLAFGLTMATVEVEECTFVLHGGAEVAEDEFTGTVDVSCPEEQSIKVSAGTCEAEIDTQTELAQITYKVSAESFPADFEAIAEVEEVEYTVTKDGFLCPFSSTGVKVDGEVGGGANFTAVDEVEEEAAVVLADAEVLPSPFKIAGTSETGVATLFINIPGEYKIWEQVLGEVIEFGYVEKAGEKTCTGVFTVNIDESKACPFKMKTVGAGKGSHTLVVTKWSQKSAKSPRVIHTRIERPK